MKTFFLIIICFINISAQTDSIKGIVLDKNSGYPVSNVYLLRAGGNIITTTDYHGEFIFPEAFTDNHIIFSHLSYRKKEVEMSSYSGYIKIEMEPVPVSLGEITVYSTKHERLKKEIAAPVEVIDGEKIVSSPAATASDLMKNEPGVSLSRDGIWGTYAYIRGLTKSNIVSLIDGNRIETSTELSAGLSLIDISEIQSIEIIKGSASSLYGSGALGGIINIITNRNFYPGQFEINGRVISSYKSVNNNSSGSLNLGAGDKNWFINFNGALRHAGNTKTPDGLLINSQFRNNSYSVSAGAKLLADQELRVIYQQYKAEDAGIPGASSLFPWQAEVKYLEAGREMFSAKYIRKNLSSSLIKISGEYYHQNIFRDVENIPHTSNYFPASETEPARRVIVQKINPYGKHTTKGFKLQSDWLFDLSHYLVAGVDLWQRDIFTSRKREVLTQILGADSLIVNSIRKTIVEKPIPDSYFRSYGFFVQDEFGLFDDKLKITAGGRYDLIEVENDELRNPLYEITGNIRNNSPASQKLFWEAGKANDVSWSGSLSFIYSLYEDIDLTLTAAKSFRSPSPEERFEYIDLGYILKIGDPHLKPERGTFIDAGLRIRKSDFTFSGNVFLNQLKNLVTEKTGIYEDRNALIKQNVGQARLSGFDFASEYYFSDEYVFYTVLSYVRGIDLENKKNLPQIPPLNGRVGVKATIFSYLNFNLFSTVFAGQHNTAEGEFETPGYAVFDIYLSSMRVQYNFLSFQLYGGIENIANKSYRNHLSSSRSFVLSEPGRNFFIKIKIDW